MRSDEKKRTLMGRVERYMFLQDIKAPAIMVETELDMVRRAAALLGPGELVECFAEFPAFAARRRRDRALEAGEYSYLDPDDRVPCEYAEVVLVEGEYPS